MLHNVNGVASEQKPHTTVMLEACIRPCSKPGELHLHEAVEEAEVVGPGIARRCICGQARVSQLQGVQRQRLQHPCDAADAAQHGLYSLQAQQERLAIAAVSNTRLEQVSCMQ